MLRLHPGALLRVQVQEDVLNLTLAQRGDPGKQRVAVVIEAAV